MGNHHTHNVLTLWKYPLLILNFDCFFFIEIIKFDKQNFISVYTKQKRAHLKNLFNAFLTPYGIFETFNDVRLLETQQIKGIKPIWFHQYVFIR